MSRDAAVPMIALATNLFVGLAPLISNPRRPVNRCFFLMTALAGFWLLALARAFASSAPETAIFWIRQCHALGFVFFTSFLCLANSIIHPDRGLLSNAAGLAWWLLADAAMTAVCQSRWLIEGVSIAAEGDALSIPRPILGPAFPAYVILVLLKCAVIVHLLVRSAFRSKGATRAELHFTILGLGACLLLGVSTTMVMPAISGDTRSVQVAPSWVILMNVIIAYGIATRRLMDVASVLRRTTAYALLGTYLCALFLGVWWLCDALFRRLGFPAEPWASLAAALPTVLSVVPARGWMRAVANRLFINFEGLDVARAVASASRLPRELSTTDHLLQEFSRIISTAAATDRVSVHLFEGPSYQSDQPAAGTPPTPWRMSGPLACLLLERAAPITVDMIARMRPSPDLEAARREMHQAGIAAAFQIPDKDRPSGAVLLGPRLSGRAYSQEDIDALQLLCDQLGLALDNAALFTQVADAKIYNDVLLDNLVSGVVATDDRATITVFNREAQRIIGLPASRALRQPIDRLPPPLRDALRKVLATGEGVKDHDAKLIGPDGAEVPVRIGTARFGHGGQPLGGLLVFSDLTAIRALELQLRRQDRLAGIGTLSAGMAHEIKNPLVAIKTFTDLLPERYADPEFRQTFSSLVGHEVQRIDGIVNQLLSFSRKTGTAMRPLSLGDTVRHALQITKHQLASRGVVVESRLDEPDCHVLGDPNQLLQALLNLILNAVEAMPRGGALNIGLGTFGEGAGQTVRLDVTDTGSGIPQSDLNQIFDAFFTTKTGGTGLGLAVVHWIVQDHGGTVTAESSSGGTTFRISLPAFRKAVAA